MTPSPCEPIDWHIFNVDYNCSDRLLFHRFELKSQLFCALISSCQSPFKLKLVVVVSFTASKTKKRKGAKKSQEVINFSEDEKVQDHQGNNYIMYIVRLNFKRVLGLDLSNQ